MKATNIKNLGYKIKKLRKQNNFLQVDFAVRTGVSTGYIGSIEQGLRYPSLKVLQKIARVLKISLSDLLK